jgi:hypothetical protein
MNYQTLIDDTTTVWTTYICRADLWRAEDSSNWQIYTIDTDWNKKYPRNSDWFPSDEFIFKASLRASYTYSYIKA